MWVNIPVPWMLWVYIYTYVYRGSPTIFYGMVSEFHHFVSGNNFQGILPRKFNSSPLKNGGWKTILSYWVPVTFQGRTVKFRGGIMVGELPGFDWRGRWANVTSSDTLHKTNIFLFPWGKGKWVQTWLGKEDMEGIDMYRSKTKDN